jgi:outer membrane biogenesis lipoprotein LolB
LLVFELTSFYFFKGFEMKKFLLLSAVLLLTACNNGQKINGHSEKTVYRSVQMIKPRLPEAMRIEYEIAFGLSREAEKDNAIFFKSVDGKTPSELIAMGKDIFQQHKAEGLVQYQKYDNWEAMIANYQKERAAQKVETDIKKDSQNNRAIDYKL